MRRSDLLEHLAERIAAVDPGHPLRVGIDGISASGKTRLARELVAPLQNRGRPVLHADLDDFHNPPEIRHRQGRDSVGGYINDSFDLDAIERLLLAPLGPTGDRRYSAGIYDLAREQAVTVPLRIAPPNAVLLCEGVMLFRDQLREYFDLRIYMHISAEEALRRGCERDAERLGGVAAVVQRYRRRYLPAQRLYLQQVQPARLAHVIIDNSDPDHPEVRNLGTTHRLG